jgi:hypothetical protein
MRRILVIPLLLCWLALAAACTKSPDGDGIASVNGSAGASASPSAVKDAAAFARCMRQHGQNVPDPDPNASFTVVPPTGEQLPAWKTAVQACRHFLPGGEAQGGVPSQELEQLRAFAVCMRAHDIEMTDPTSDGDMQINGRFEHVTRAQLENDPGYKAAMTACKDKLPVPADTKREDK